MGRRARRVFAGLALAAVLTTTGCEPSGGSAAETCDRLTGRAAPGVNVNTLYALPPAQLGAAVRDLQDLGVGWARFDLDWKLVQPEQDGPLRISGYDRLIEALGRGKIRSLVVLYDAPSWANGGHAENFFPPVDPSQAAAFAGLLAARYRGRVAAWEIWNEPNIARFWKPAPDPSAYARLLQASAQRIHAADPAALVLSAGLAQVGDGDGQMPAMRFMETLYGQVGRESFDAVGAHPYTSPARPLLYGRNNWARTWWGPDSLRALMSRHGDADKPIWVTEFGAPTFGDDPLRRVSEAEQAAMLRSAFANLPARGAGPIFWYNLRDFCPYAPGRSIECYFGLQRSDGLPKPAYRAMQALSACLRRNPLQSDRISLKTP